MQSRSSARRRSCASPTVTARKRKTLPGRACPSFQNAALGTVKGLMKPPVLGPSLMRMMGVWPARLIAPERIAVIEDVRRVLPVLGPLVGGALGKAEGRAGQPHAGAAALRLHEPFARQEALDGGLRRARNRSGRRRPRSSHARRRRDGRPAIRRSTSRMGGAASSLADRDSLPRLQAYPFTPPTPAIWKVEREPSTGGVSMPPANAM